MKNEAEYVKKQRDELVKMVQLYIGKANAARGMHREKYAEIASLMDDVQITLQDYIDVLQSKE